MQNVKTLLELLWFIFFSIPLCLVVLLFIEIAYFTQTIKNVLQCTKLMMFRHFPRK